MCQAKAEEQLAQIMLGTAEALSKTPSYSVLVTMLEHNANPSPNQHAFPPPFNILQLLLPSLPSPHRCPLYQSKASNGMCHHWCIFGMKLGQKLHQTWRSTSKALFLALNILRMTSP
ncbi:hypothetical protein CEUSTIGMA_g12825.t1 [Chlamydomonas eustigma]|uniref:Uncharacterized protein n=1 Tax=Chlamydomonas eustigma TaxID=1157962 RepID=A0A250XR27_9CHLO|nr:hypothetical protein CEUSTIGMA_g12825.t1 [Chlamydomonas eustigma]|eukprot:GAX85409.1 hypothetical protein CEUSTIGMA_g12825.t1 [Chlamydomonas eustigma]